MSFCKPALAPTAPRGAAGQGILYTGLFITAHDAMHGLVAPALLSTLQLFYFGPYLPHREPAGGHDNPHRAKSNDFSVIWSFLTCYHFGYHWEHHEFRHVPWWKLPAVRREILYTAD